MTIDCSVLRLQHSVVPGVAVSRVLSGTRALEHQLEEYSLVLADVDERGGWREQLPEPASL